MVSNRFNIQLASAFLVVGSLMFRMKETAVIKEENEYSLLTEDEFIDVRYLTLLKNKVIKIK
jgi:hypothetical protein